MDDIILVDFSWVVHRMWWAHKDLQVTLHDGRELKSGHLYGVSKLLGKLRAAYPTSDIVLCLDGVAKHGKSLSADYKANRSPSSVTVAFDDLGVMVACALAFSRVSVAFNRDLEADEVISYLTRFYAPHRNRVIVYSADCDMLQLLTVGDNVFIAKEFDKKTGKLALIDETVYATDPKYLDKFQGCSVSVLPLYRAMVGDSSDNLIGFPRMRKKVAKELAEAYVTERRLSGACLAGVDPLFPATFSDFLPRLRVNLEIMKLPTVEELEGRGTVPRMYGTFVETTAFMLYSLYRIRSASPLETAVLSDWEEDAAMQLRDEVNSSWALPTTGSADVR